MIRASLLVLLVASVVNAQESKRPPIVLSFNGPKILAELAKRDGKTILSVKSLDEDDETKKDFKEIKALPVPEKEPTLEGGDFSADQAHLVVVLTAEKKTQVVLYDLKSAKRLWAKEESSLLVPPFFSDDGKRIIILTKKDALLELSVKDGSVLKRLEP